MVRFVRHVVVLSLVPALSPVPSLASTYVGHGHADGCAHGAEGKPCCCRKSCARPQPEELDGPACHLAATEEASSPFWKSCETRSQVELPSPQRLYELAVVPADLIGPADSGSFAVRRFEVQAAPANPPLSPPPQTV